jgi:hypothetical protein
MPEFWKRPASRVIAFGASIALLLVTIFIFDSPSSDENAPDGPLVCETDSQSVQSPLFSDVMRDMAVRTLSNEPTMLHDLAGKELTVIITCSYRCPCSDGYTERLADLRSRYEPLGVSFIALHSNVDETADAMKTYINRKHYPLPVYQDEGAMVADALSAAVTPEAFVFTPDWHLQYHGRIDDDKGGLFVTETTLKNALDTLLMHKPLTFREKMALGCAIVRDNQS